MTSGKGNCFANAISALRVKKTANNEPNPSAPVISSFIDKLKFLNIFGARI